MFQKISFTNPTAVRFAFFIIRQRRDCFGIPLQRITPAAIWAASSTPTEMQTVFAAQDLFRCISNIFCRSFSSSSKRVSPKSKRKPVENFYNFRFFSYLPLDKRRKICYNIRVRKMNMRSWWNRQTRYFEVVVRRLVGVQVPPTAPTKKELLSTKSSFFVYPSRRLGISSPREVRCISSRAAHRPCISSRASVYPPAA